MRINVNIRIVLSVAVFLAVAVLLVACGDSGKDKAKTKKAAGKISTYYYSIWRPPSPD